MTLRKPNHFLKAIIPLNVTSTIIKRKDSTLIPEIDELMHLISLESQRQVPSDKLYSNLELIDFGYLIDFINVLGIEYEKNILNGSASEVGDYLSWSISMMNQIVEKLFNHGSKEDILPYLDSIYRYLSEDDSSVLDTSDTVYDIGFVFGSSSNLRTDKAIELFNHGKVRSIMVSGKAPIYSDSKVPEASRLAKYAIDKGVPDDCIIEEPLGMSIPDNVKRSLDLLEQSKKIPNSLIIVSSPFAMRRCYIDWIKFLPREIESIIAIKRYNSSVSERFDRDNWYKQEDTFRIVLNEYFKLRGEWLIDCMLAKI